MKYGNHSNSHLHINKLSLDENINDMKLCNEKIKNIIGKDVKLYRGPYGEYNNIVIEASERLNMKVIQWNIDTLDYKNPSQEEMIERINKNIKKGSIILMHNGTQNTAKSLDAIIKNIVSQGYTIVPVGEMIYFENYIINEQGEQKLNN